MAQAAVATAAHLQAFGEVGQKLPYRKQAQFFLNAMWAEHQGDAEKCWEYVCKMEELDEKDGEEGKNLDEFQAHRFLEHFGQTLTVIEMRKVLKEIDIDTDNRMSFLEYVVYHFKIDVDVMMERPQGTNQALDDAEAALEEVEKEIAAIEKKKGKLEKAAQGSGVKAMRAKNELDQLLAADQLELNRKVITAQAAVRKAQKSTDLSSMGKLWWIERELSEAAKYKPKGGVRRGSRFGR